MLTITNYLKNPRVEELDARNKELEIRVKELSDSVISMPTMGTLSLNKARESVALQNEIINNQLEIDKNMRVLEAKYDDKNMKFDFSLKDNEGKEYPVSECKIPFLLYVATLCKDEADKLTKENNNG